MALPLAPVIFCLFQHFLKNPPFHHFFSPTLPHFPFSNSPKPSPALTPAPFSRRRAPIGHSDPAFSRAPAPDWSFSSVSGCSHPSIGSALVSFIRLHWLLFIYIGSYSFFLSFLFLFLHLRSFSSHSFLRSRLQTLFTSGFFPPSSFSSSFSPLAPIHFFYSFFSPNAFKPIPLSFCLKTHPLLFLSFLPFLSFPPFSLIGSSSIRPRSSPFFFLFFSVRLWFSSSDGRRLRIYVTEGQRREETRR